MRDKKISGAHHRLYRGLGSVLAPFSPLYLRTRGKKEIRARLGERYGRSAIPRPLGPVAWLHAASVGESLAALAFIDELIERGFSVLLTTGTATSAEIMADRLPEGAVHQFVPLDLLPFVNRFLDHWRPDITFLVEQEVWPNIVTCCAARAIPTVLLNGRISAKSFARWNKMPKFSSAIFRGLNLVCSQNQIYDERFRTLGAARTVLTGNLKLDAPVPEPEIFALSELQHAVQERPIFLAASTHPGEEEQMEKIHLVLKDHVPGLLTIIVPRHPERADEIAQALAAGSLKTARRGWGQLPQPGHDLYLADTLGELPLFYSLANFAFLGGSLSKIGGHNPIEAIEYGCAVLHGPHVYNFSDFYAALDESGGALPVQNAKELGSNVFRLHQDTNLLTSIQQAAATTLASQRGALARTMQAVEPHISAITLQAHFGRMR